MLKFLTLFFLLGSIQISSSGLKAKFSSLDPLSISQNFAFYELYPNTKEGQLALQRAWKLLNNHFHSDATGKVLPKIDIQPIIQIVNRQNATPPELTPEELFSIDQLGSNLQNRNLKGHTVWSLEEVLSLEPEEIDICRALFLAEYGESDEAKKLIRFYESSIDLMTMQILAHLPCNASPTQMIRAMNDFIFHEMRFRFPPHSLHVKDIDIYTFLPSVIDSRRGVCLGVSILYLCIGQRLGLNLEAVTPPGHIYVRYLKDDGEHLNIETTARGIHVPSEKYLGIETRKLQTRNNKEIVGLAFINQASVNWMKKEYQTAVSLYERALPFLPNDTLLKELLAYNYLFVGKTEEGRKLLQLVRETLPDHVVSKDTVPCDFLDGKVDAEGIKALFIGVDENKSSIASKQKELQEVIAKYPYFRAGLLSLASSYLQLGREKEALKILQTYYEIDSSDPVVNYYLAALFMERFDFKLAWKHLIRAESLAALRDHQPKALKELRRELMQVCPAPSQNTCNNESHFL